MGDPHAERRALFQAVDDIVNTSGSGSKGGPMTNRVVPIPDTDKHLWPAFADVFHRFETSGGKG